MFERSRIARSWYHGDLAEQHKVDCHDSLVGLNRGETLSGMSVRHLQGDRHCSAAWKLNTGSTATCTCTADYKMHCQTILSRFVCHSVEAAQV